MHWWKGSSLRSPQSTLEHFQWKSFASLTSWAIFVYLKTFAFALFCSFLQGWTCQNGSDLCILLWQYFASICIICSIALRNIDLHYIALTCQPLMQRPPTPPACSFIPIWICEVLKVDEEVIIPGCNQHSLPEIWTSRCEPEAWGKSLFGQPHPYRLRRRLYEGMEYEVLAECAHGMVW